MQPATYSSYGFVSYDFIIQSYENIFNHFTKNLQKTFLIKRIEYYNIFLIFLFTIYISARTTARLYLLCMTMTVLLVLHTVLTEIVRNAIHIQAMLQLRVNRKTPSLKILSHTIRCQALHI